MRILHGVLAVWLSLPLCLAGAETSRAAPVPDQPMILSAGLMGHRVCGSLAVTEAINSFTCDPLPSKENTGWQLTPPSYTNSAGKTVDNQGVVLRVLTPSLTALVVKYHGASSDFVQTQIATGPGDPAPVGYGGQVAVSASDNGFSKTWILQFRLRVCEDQARIDIYNVGADGTGSASPLLVWFLRGLSDMADCSTEGSLVPIQGSTGGTTGASGGHPTRCETGICTNCAAYHPKSANQWTAVSTACGADLTSVLKEYGYLNPDGTPTARGRVCQVTLAKTPAQCAGP